MLDMLTSIGDVVAVLIMIGIIGGIGFSYILLVLLRIFQMQMKERLKT